MREAAAELREARHALEDETRAAQPRNEAPAAVSAGPCPEPAPYVYFRITDVHGDTFDLVSDEGEEWGGIHADPEQVAVMEVGGRMTWDGETMENYMPPELLAQARGQVDKLNSLPAADRVQMRTADTVQTLRECGYVLDSDNRAVPAVRV